MSSIELDPIIELSCLEISDSNKVAFSKQIDDVLNYMAVINNVKQVASDDFQWPIHKDVVIRPDAPKPFSHDLVAENAPEFSDGCFVVPKILS